MTFNKLSHIFFPIRPQVLVGLLLSGFTFVCSSLQARVAAVCGEENRSIALPVNTLEGCLSNGLHYLILPNATPAHTVEMRLVMRLGAVQETERQKGCAHFLEHMAFAGTEHFPKRSMIDYLEGLGMKFGRDINAVTGYDRTIFMLTVPMNADDYHILDSTLLVLRDWLCGISFKPERIKQERGVILEELRTYRNDDIFYDLKIGQSRFKDRMPLGSSDDIRRVKRRQLVNFYDKWYTPQLASLVVVGNVMPTEVERRIEQLFSGIPQKNVDDYCVYPLTYDKGVQLAEVRDSIERSSELEIIVPQRATVGRDIETTILKEQEHLASYAIDRRLSARRMPCNVSNDWYLSDLNHFVFALKGKTKEDLLTLVKRLSCEMEQLISEGWNKDEYTQLKADYCARIKAYDPDRPSYAFCDDFTDYILMGDRYLHHAADADAVKEGVMATEMSFLQKHLSRLRDHMQQQLLLTYRNNSGAQHSLTKDEVLAAWEEGCKLEAQPFKFHPRRERKVTVVTPEVLTTTHVDASAAVVSEQHYDDTNITEVKLNNGIRMLFRPTAKGDSTLLMNWFGNGGLANVPPHLYHQYESTAGYMEMGGIARAEGYELSNYMAETGILLNLSIGGFWHDILGTAPVARCGELFNLVVEKILRPEMCYDDFEEIRRDDLEDFGKKTVLDQLMQRASDRLLVNRMDSLVGNSPSTWFREKTREDVEQMNLDSVACYFTTLYSQLEGTTIVLTGNYDIDFVKCRAINTFAPLQTLPLPYQSFVPDIKMPSKHYVEGFDNDNATQTIIDYVYAGHYVPSLRGGLILKLMRDLLQDRMLRVLRERENIVYSPYASLYYFGEPNRRYYFDLSISVDTDNSLRADEYVREIVSSLQAKAVSEEELDKLKKGFLVNKQQMLTEDAAVEWRNILSTLVKNGESIADFDNYQQQLDAITPEMVRQAFVDLMPQERTILLYLGKHQSYDK